MHDSTNSPPDFFDTSIVHKTYKFYVLLHTTVGNFPKRERYSIGQAASATTLETLKLMFAANSQRQRQRLATLRTIDTNLKVLKTFIRLGFDVRALSEKQYLDLETHLQELGRMLGGWIKHTQQENSAR